MDIKATDMKRRLRKDFVKKTRYDYDIVYLLYILSTSCLLLCLQLTQDGKKLLYKVNTVY